MRVRLDVLDDDGEIVRLGASIALEAGRHELRYATDTGALLLLDGTVRGAFDREHRAIHLELDAPARIVEVRVERRSLPTSHLPAGDGLRWRAMLAGARREPARTLTATTGLRPICGKGRRLAEAARAAREPACFGHAHLDVAWLWRYSETRRKAARTFATAARQLAFDRDYVFVQSQPQLYAWVERDEPTLFAQVATFAREGRFDTSGAASWVEPDCNVPSGESLLRQLAYGKRYIAERFGREATVAWLPDTFGFASTLPMLLRHAGVDAFATTKLMWNDTNRFPHERFVWSAPDGSAVLAALFASYEGDLDDARIERARARREPLVLGYGDGGGGATDAMVRRARFAGAWTTLAAWFERARADAREQPPAAYRGDLYLEYHRGTYTSHRDLKARNAALERRLRETEELGAWALALHASPFFLAEFRAQIREAWEIVLRAQFHDVITGTCIGEVARDVHAEYDRADALLANLGANARSVLPRASVAANTRAERRERAPRRERAAYAFENGFVRARVRSDGTLLDLATTSGSNAIGSGGANRLRAFNDRPKRWDAWNVDADYRRRRAGLRLEGAALEDDGLEIRFTVGRGSPGVMRYSLVEGEPFLRVEFGIAWSEAHVLLRVESELALGDASARFGAPHGVVARDLEGRSRLARARFEVPGQRFARIDGRTPAGASAGLALFSLDGYGWNARASGRATVALGHSLIRGPRWPDPASDLGDHLMSLAYVPLDGHVSNGTLEGLWQRFAGAPDVAMFASDDPAIAVLATKPADDGDGVIVRARECDGAARAATIRCAARAREVAECDALERERDALSPIRLDDGALQTHFEPFQLRTFRVRLA